MQIDEQLLDEAQPSLEDEVPKRQLAIELAAVTCLAYVPFMTDAVVWMNEDATGDFTRSMLSHTASSLQVFAPLLYIMWRSSGGLAEFGIVKPQPLMDGVLSIVVFTFIWLFATCVAVVFTATNEDVGAFVGPSGYGQHLLLIVAMIANSLSEEFFMRAYLITRLQQLGAHVSTAIVGSAILFASYHVYQGYDALLPVAVDGLIYAAVFAFTRRIWPLVVSHTLYNLLVFTGP